MTRRIRDSLFYMALLWVLFSRPDRSPGDDNVLPSRSLLSRERETILSFAYRTEVGDERLMTVVREFVEVNRERTPAEEAVFLKMALQHRGRGVFQSPTGDTAFWLLDATAMESVSRAAPIGVVYASDPRSNPMQLWAADVVWHPTREQFLLVLTASQSHRFSAAVFPIDLDARLNVPSPTLVGREDWTKLPKPIKAIAELRTELPVIVGGPSCCGLCSISSLKAMPDERGLLIAANPRSDLCPPFFFRYQFRERKWTGMELKTGEVPRKSKYDELLEARGESLDPPIEEGDPGGSRRTKPIRLKPTPDPRSSKPSPTPSAPK